MCSNIQVQVLTYKMMTMCVWCKQTVERFIQFERSSVVPLLFRGLTIGNMIFPSSSLSSLSASCMAWRGERTCNIATVRVTPVTWAHLGIHYGPQWQWKHWENQLATSYLLNQNWQHFQWALLDYKGIAVRETLKGEVLTRCTNRVHHLHCLCIRGCQCNTMSYGSMYHQNNDVWHHCYTPTTVSVLPRQIGRKYM